MRRYRRRPRDLAGRLHHLEPGRRRCDMQYHVGECLCVRERHRSHADTVNNNTAADNNASPANDNDIG